MLMASLVVYLLPSGIFDSPVVMLLASLDALSWYFFLSLSALVSVIAQSCEDRHQDGTTYRNIFERHPLGVQSHHNSGHLIVPGCSVTRLILRCSLCGSRRWLAGDQLLAFLLMVSRCEVPSELGLDANLQGSRSVGRDVIASDKQLCRDGVETETSKRFGCQATEGIVIVGIDLSREDIFGSSAKFIVYEKLN